MFKDKSCKQYARHGFGKDFPFGRGFRGFMGFGPGGFGAARWERGDLKYVILDLLSEQPRHGYDIIQELEKKFHGFYSPSPGSVYPILQMLEDQELVESNQQGGKKVYTITESGKTFLKEHKDELDKLQERMGPPWGGKESSDVHELMGEVRHIGFFLFHKAASGELNNTEKRQRLRTAMAAFKKELEEIFQDAK